MRELVVTVLDVHHWELRKLRRQRRTYLGLAFSAFAGPAFVVAILLGAPSPDVVYGSVVRSSGLTMPLIVLSYAARYGVGALIVALVAGDIFAAEDQQRTTKTILTRSVGRSEIFLGKLLASATYAVLVLVTMGVFALTAGVAAWGFNPLATIAGGGEPPAVSQVRTLSAAAALGWVAAAHAVYLLPLLGFVAIALFLSAVTRNGVAAIVGTLMLAVALYGLVEAVGLHGGPAPYLLASHFDAWQGLLRPSPDWSIVGRAAWVCGLYAFVPLLAAWIYFKRRDVADD